MRGRCLDREDVPYKAIDHLIDELSDWWLEQEPKEAQALLPRDAYLLPALFPVLDRVPAIADAPRTRIVADPQARRTHAFDALRETLQRLGDRHTVVLFLDDMQWVDRDTTALLADLMRAPDPPPVLLVLATRTEGSEPVVDLVRRMDAAQRLIDLGPLDDAAALAIAVSHLGEDNRDTAEQLVREADGSPLFLIELARYLHGRTIEEIAGKGLDAMLSERIDGLGEAGRVLAEMASVAGEPMTRARARGDDRGRARRDVAPAVAAARSACGADARPRAPRTRSSRITRGRSAGAAASTTSAAPATTARWRSRCRAEGARPASARHRRRRRPSTRRAMRGAPATRRARRARLRPVVAVVRDPAPRAAVDRRRAPRGAHVARRRAPSDAASAQSRRAVPGRGLAPTHRPR